MVYPPNKPSQGHMPTEDGIGNTHISANHLAPSFMVHIGQEHCHLLQNPLYCHNPMPQ